MIYFDTIDISEGIDINKTSKSKECNICHYWHFFINNLSFNHMYAIDAMMMSINDVYEP